MQILFVFAVSILGGFFNAMFNVVNDLIFATVLLQMIFATDLHLGFTIFAGVIFLRCFQLY